MAERRAQARALARGRIRLALVAAVLVGLGALTFASVQGYFDVEEVRLPDVTGRSLEEASRILRESDLEVATYPDQAVGLPPDVVTRQAPPAGARVRRGRRVNVGVNTPDEANRTPTLVGATEAQATSTLADLNLGIGEVTYRHGDAPRGRVLEQSPAAGEPMGDAVVSLVVSRGPEPEPRELPDVVGRDVEAAEARLREAGFRRIETLPSRLARRDAGEVTEQHPAAGERLAPGTAVTLHYALDGGKVVQVPPVQGLAPWRARLALESAGLAVGHVEYVDRPDEPRGVMEVRPDGLTLAGSPLQLVVNGTERALGDVRSDPRDGIGVSRADPRDEVDEEDPAEAGGRLVPFRFAPEELGVPSLLESDYHLRLVVQDAEGERTVVDEQVGAGESVEERVRVHGNAPLLQTYVNDVFFQAWRP